MKDELSGGKRRSSGLELLRIISILMVIAGHYTVFGGYEPFTVQNLGGGVIFLQAISMFSRMACSLFAMISGFFLIERKMIDYSKAAMIVFDVLFFTVVIAAFARATGVVHMTLRDLIYSGVYWFIIYYLIFYFFVPYINKLLCSLDKAGFVKLLALMFCFWSVVPTLTLRQINFSDMDFFIVMYTAGAFIRLYVYRKVHYRNFWNLLIALAAAAFMVFSVGVFDAIGTATGKDIYVEIVACYFREFNMIPTVICAVFLFLYFSNLTFYSEAVNFMAGSTLHILILHNNEFLRQWIWEGIYPNAEYIVWPYVHAPIKIICVYIGCLLISVMYRQIIRKPVQRVVSKKLSAVSLQRV